MMRAIKSKPFIVLWCLLIPILTANSNDKKAVGKAEMAETTAKAESVIKVTPPPFKKFVVVNTVKSPNT